MIRWVCSSSAVAFGAGADGAFVAQELQQRSNKTKEIIRKWLTGMGKLYLKLMRRAKPQATDIFKGGLVVSM